MCDEHVLDRGDGAGDDHAWSTPSAAPRVAAGDTPGGLERALHRPVLPKRIRRVLGAARVVLARGRASDARRRETCRRTRLSTFMRAPSRSPRRHARRARPPPAHPPPRSSPSRRRARSRFRAGRPRAERPELAESALDAVSAHGVARAFRHRKPEARLVFLLVAREPVEHEEPRRRRAALAVDGIEVLRAGEPVPALHGSVSLDRGER